MKKPEKPLDAHGNPAGTDPGAALRLAFARDPTAIDAAAWNALLARQRTPTPFMRHEYLAALHASGGAVAATGWTPQFALLWDGAELAAACPLYLKSHSYGEYVFDWAWANAYAEHGLPYYPKALVAVPFTPVPGARLLARDTVTREELVRRLVHWCARAGLSSLHLLFGAADDLAACKAAGLMQRHQVQFHWKDMRPPRSTAAPVALPAPEPQYRDFEDFLAALKPDKRKKIRAKRRKVRDAGVGFRWAQGAAITPADWAFFYRCYERTYLEHGNAPYLSPAFFERMARDMAANWVLFIAERDGQPIASSLIAIDAVNGQPAPGGAAWGRYWGALERVDCLHFEACYYQPIEWCIAHGVSRFEGGAQGEHKMARALLPVVTTSSHWLAHPAFAEAVERFLTREDRALRAYVDDLRARTPLRSEKS